MSRRLLVACFAAIVTLANLPVPQVLYGQGGADAELIKRARAIHDRVITLDTHADISPNNFTKERNYTQDLGNQVNLPKMISGGLDAVFFIVYVGQGELTPAGYDDASSRCECPAIRPIAGIPRDTGRS